MNTLLIVGNDHWGHMAGIAAQKKTNVIIALDVSNSLRRILRLIIKRKISAFLILKMAIAEFLRKKVNFTPSITIKSNGDIFVLLKAQPIDRVILFRAGLIINKDILQATSVENIHCAQIPEFGGIGSIDKALREGKFEQEATLHRVTSRIDDGEILMTEKYTLNPQKTYKQNEDTAYIAGITLLNKTL